MLGFVLEEKDLETSFESSSMICSQAASASAFFNVSSSRYDYFFLFTGNGCSDIPNPVRLYFLSPSLSKASLFERKIRYSIGGFN